MKGSRWVLDGKLYQGFYDSSQQLPPELWLIQTHAGPERTGNGEWPGWEVRGVRTDRLRGILAR